MTDREDANKMSEIDRIEEAARYLDYPPGLLSPTARTEEFAKAYEEMRELAAKYRLKLTLPLSKRRTRTDIEPTTTWLTFDHTSSRVVVAKNRDRSSS